LKLAYQYLEVGGVATCTLNAADEIALPFAGAKTGRTGRCHNLLDPLGFALENFDVIGFWRNTDAGSSRRSYGLTRESQTNRRGSTQTLG
jgi:hypothetical protein